MFCTRLVCYQQADIRTRSHGSRQLVDDKFVASCQQTCCKLIVKTCYPQACCKLFQQVVTSLQINFNRLVATWQSRWNLLTSSNKPLKWATCNKSAAFLAVSMLAHLSLKRENWQYSQFIFIYKQIKTYLFYNILHKPLGPEPVV